MKNLQRINKKAWKKTNDPHYCPFVSCFLGAVCGIFFNSCFSVSPRIYCVLFLVGTAAVLFRIVLTKNYRLLDKDSLGFWSVVVLSFLLFGLNHELDHNRVAEDDISRWSTEKNLPVIAEGWIAQLPVYVPVRPAYLGENIPLTDLTVTELVMKGLFRNGSWNSCSGRVIVRISGDLTRLRIGDLVRIKGTFSLILPPDNRYEFNRGADLLADGIRCKVHVDSPQAVELLQEKDRFPVSRFFENLRRSARSIYRESLSEVNASLASAIVFGLRADLDFNVVENFKQTGTVHILAISGLHLAIVCGIIFFILNTLGVPKVPATILLMVATVFYAMAAGMQPPVSRSAIMVLAFCLRSLVHRRGDGINTLVFAAILLLLINPDELFQCGTQFSFMAVGIFLWFPRYNTGQERIIDFILVFRKQYLLWRRYRKIAREGVQVYTQIPVMEWDKVIRVFFRVKLVHFLLVTIVIWLVMSPLLIRNTSLVTPSAIFINPLIILPLTAVLFLALFLVLFGGGIPFLSGILGSLTNTMFDFLQGIVSWGRLTPIGFHYVAQLPDWWCLVFYLPLIFMTIFPKFRPFRRKVLIFLVYWSILGFFLPVIFFKSNQMTDRFEANIFSVGHGAAFLMTFPDGRTVLLDCGCFTSPRKTGNIIKQTLWNKNIKKIDLLIFSHADSDHYNASDLIIKNFRIGRVLVPELMFQKDNIYVQRLHLLLSDRKIPIYSVDADTDPARLGFPELSILHPQKMGTDKISAQKSNQYCLVIRIDYLGKSILFPGDLEDNNAPFLEKECDKVDVLLAPHHGGKVKRYQTLLDRIRPEDIIISGGSLQNNTSEETKLIQKGYHVYNTQRNGEIIIQIDRPVQNSFEGINRQSKIRILPFRK